MHYAVKFVNDKALPAEHDWIVLETPDQVVGFVKWSAVSPQVIGEAWGAVRRLARQQLQPA